MSATNFTVKLSVTPEVECMNDIKWRNEFLTEEIVYTNLLITCAFNAVIFPFTMILNGAFILCVFLDRGLQSQKSVVLLAFLAITDLLVGAVIQPFFVGGSVCRLIQTCEFGQTISRVVCFFITICAFSSFFHTSLVSCDRYVAVQHALRYKVIVTTNKLRLGTVVAWIFSVLFTLMFNFLSETKIIVLVVLVIVSALDVYFYKVIYLESQRLSRNINVLTPHQQTNSLNQKRKFKAAKTTLLIIVCLSVCYFPPFFVQLVSIFILPVNSSNASGWFCVFLWTRTMMMVNSLCNALIYHNRVPRFRKTIRRLLKTKRRRTSVCQQPDIRQSIKRLDGAQSNRVEDGVLTVQTGLPFILKNETGEKTKVTVHSKPEKNTENLQDDVESSMNDVTEEKKVSNTKL